MLHSNNFLILQKNILQNNKLFLVYLVVKPMPMVNENLKYKLSPYEYIIIWKRDITLEFL